MSDFDLKHERERIRRTHEAHAPKAYFTEEEYEAALDEIERLEWKLQFVGSRANCFDCIYRKDCPNENHDIRSVCQVAKNRIVFAETAWQKHKEETT